MCSSFLFSISASPNQPLALHADPWGRPPHLTAGYNFAAQSILVRCTPDKIGV